MVITIVATVMIWVAYFLILYGVVGFIQDKRFFSSAPKENLEAIPDWGFVPDRVVHAPIELSTIVTAGVAHDGVVITEGTGERIHCGGRQLVWRLGFTCLDRTPWPF